MAEEGSLLEGRFYTMGEIEKATGVPAATLRAWERRYGVPVPGRSSGRQRLYSEADLSMLKWLLARQKEGMSISRAVAAWKYQTARLGPAAGRVETGSDPSQGLERLQSGWVNACLRYDRPLAESVSSQAFALYSVAEVCTTVLLGGLSQIGDEWFNGRATVHQEHFASALASHQIERLIGATVPWRRERVLLACPPGELHSFSLLFLSLLLRQRGLNTVLLGASVPGERLDSALAEVQPDLVVLSSQRLPDATALLTMAETLRQMGMTVGFGGGVFNGEPSLQDRIPAYFLGETLSGAVDSIERLLADRPGPHVPLRETPMTSRELECYQSRLYRIESDVRSAIGVSASPHVVSEANDNISSHLIAAAEIGDFTALHDGRPWLEASFKAAPDRIQALRSYLTVYALAAEVHLGECGGPILQWLRSTREPEPAYASPEN